MAISKDKTGVLINMSRETKAKLEELAKKDGRSMTNLINKILLDYLKDK
jgi:predicted DNA-binding protein